MSVQLFCSQIAVVASRPVGLDDQRHRGIEVTDESSMVVDGLELLAVVGVAELLAEVDGRGGRREVDVDIDAAELLTAAAPAEAVPAVGAEQATVKTEAESSAAAAMPWRKFTRDTFGRARGWRAESGIGGRRSPVDPRPARPAVQPDGGQETARQHQGHRNGK